VFLHDRFTDTQELAVEGLPDDQVPALCDRIMTAAAQPTMSQRPRLPAASKLLD
jgi:hypothetical protein